MTRLTVKELLNAIQAGPQAWSDQTVLGVFEDVAASSAEVGEAVAVEALSRVLESSDADEDLLDDLVHDAASRIGSGVNNGGSEEQVEFLGNEPALEGDADQGTLDDAVHDAASRIGSDVNNGGYREQVQFLIREIGLDEVATVFRDHGLIA